MAEGLRHGKIGEETLETLVKIGIEIIDFATSRCLEEEIRSDALCSMAMQSAVVDFTDRCMNHYAAEDKTAGEIAGHVAGVLDEVAGNFTSEADRYRAVSKAAQN